MSRNAQFFSQWTPLRLPWFLHLTALLLAGGLLPAAAEPPAVPASTVAPATINSRVVIAQDNAATHELVPDAGVIQGMVDHAITNLTDAKSLNAAWLNLVTTQDTVGIKVFSQPGAYAGTRPAVVTAVVKDLLAAGLPPQHIIVWDKRLIDLRLAGYLELAGKYGIRILGATEAGWDASTNYESSVLGTPRWGDLEFGETGDHIGRRSYVTKILTHEVTKIINIAPLMHHNQAGVSGCLYSLATGSVDNTFRFERSPEVMARSLPEIYALGIVGDRVVLSIVDALICQYEGEQRGLLHYSALLNELRFSRDPVALDALSLKEIETQRQLAGERAPKLGAELLDNAALLELGLADLRRIPVFRLP